MAERGRGREPMCGGRGVEIGTGIQIARGGAPTPAAGGQRVWSLAMAKVMVRSLQATVTVRPAAVDGRTACQNSTCIKRAVLPPRPGPLPHVTSLP